MSLGGGFWQGCSTKKSKSRWEIWERAPIYRCSLRSCLLLLLNWTFFIYLDLIELFHLLIWSQRASVINYEIILNQTVNNKSNIIKKKDLNFKQQNKRLRSLRNFLFPQTYFTSWQFLTSESHWHNQSSLMKIFKVKALGNITFSLWKINHLFRRVKFVIM